MESLKCKSFRHVFSKSYPLPQEMKRTFMIECIMDKIPKSTTIHGLFTSLHPSRSWSLEIVDPDIIYTALNQKKQHKTPMRMRQVIRHLRNEDDRTISSRTVSKLLHSLSTSMLMNLFYSIHRS